MTEQEFAYLFSMPTVHTAADPEFDLDVKDATCQDCAGAGEIGAGHPDDARPCHCSPRPIAEEIPY